MARTLSLGLARQRGFCHRLHPARARKARRCLHEKVQRCVRQIPRISGIMVHRCPHSQISRRQIPHRGFVQLSRPGGNRRLHHVGRLLAGRILSFKKQRLHSRADKERTNKRARFQNARKRPSLSIRMRSWRSGTGSFHPRTRLRSRRRQRQLGRLVFARSNPGPGNGIYLFSGRARELFYMGPHTSRI